MSEHYCKNCKKSEGDTCALTGATHTTGIECPSFKQKESEMFKVDDRVKVVASFGSIIGKTGVIDDIDDSCFPYKVTVEGDTTLWNCAARDLELVEEKYIVGVDLAVPGSDYIAIRTFESGATRDTAQGKLDYIKALSPIVLRRYVQYLDKHRKQPDGLYRDFDNWKKGIPQPVYRSSGGRHFFSDWLLSEGYETGDNHGSVELEDAICAQLFNLMGRLHEVLKERLKKKDCTAPTENSFDPNTTQIKDRTATTKGGY